MNLFQRRPPRLAQPPRLRRRRLPAWRVALRVMVWSVFFGVLAARWRMAVDPQGGFGGRGWEVRNGGWNWDPQGGRRYRASRQVPTPVSPLPTNLWRMQIEVSARDMQVLRTTSFEWRRPANSKRPEVKVTVREGDRVYTNVALHLKGSAGSFRPVDGTPGMTLNFSKHAKGQNFHGHTKLSLNNAVQDPTYLAEALSHELFESGGVPSPGKDHVTVVLNGRDLGLYVFSEGWGKPFLRRHFPDPDGPLYDGGFVQDLDADLSINSGPDDAGREPLDRVLAAAEERDPGERWRRLQETLDVDRFARLLALEVMTCHWDGYGLNRNNYRVFHDRATGRLVFLPHGMDQMFGRGERMPPDSSIEPAMRGTVARAFLFCAEGRALYFRHMKEFRAGFFSEEAMTNRLRELSNRIRPTLAAYSPGLAAEHDRAVRGFADAIRRRCQSIDEQLAQPRDPVEFDADGVFRPENWESRRGTQGRGGNAAFGRGEQEGVKVLKVAARAGGASGSWRTRVRVGPGRYRLEGRVWTEGVQGHGGTCLRISGGARRMVAGPDGQWQPLAFHFEIVGPMSEVELVCEFDSAAGEARFDLGSLRIVQD